MFTLTGSDGSKQTLGTGGDGTVFFDNLVYGVTYTWEETASPHGYLLDEGNTGTWAVGKHDDLVTVTCENQRRPGSITVQKQDAEGNPLPGCTFLLEYYDGSQWQPVASRSGSYVSTGIYDSDVNNALSGYAIEGVEFSYLRLGQLSIYKGPSKDGQQEVIPLYGFTENTKTGSQETIRFLSALGLSTNDAYRVDHDSRQNRVWYFQSDTLANALSDALNRNSTATKTALEQYMQDCGGTALPETDQNGKTGASNLEQGLYLLIETRVPENVTSTTDPFLVSLPMTTVDGETWNYDVTVYPKNETGMPDLTKTVRESSADTGKNNGSTDDITDGYAHTATASAGDVVDYQVISTLPTITSPATALTTYTFADSLSKGIQYNHNDVKLEFFRDKTCTDLVTTWTEADGKFTASYTDYDAAIGSSMTIEIAPEGLKEINSAESVYAPAVSLRRGYSDLTLRITYSCTVNSDASCPADCRRQCSRI